MRSATKRKTGRDPEYLEWIRSLACVVCARVAWRRTSEGVKQDTPTEAAHVGTRGLSQKCPDRETIPLCAYHHRTGTYALHRLGKNWWKLHGIDRDALIAELQKRFQEEQTHDRKST